LAPEGMSESNIKIANKTFKNMANSKYLAMPPKYQNYMRYEIKNRIHLANVCYSLVQGIFLPSAI
jgi:glyoxylate utilization-related uncharacterized protein